MKADECYDTAPSNKQRDCLGQQKDLENRLISVKEQLVGIRGALLGIDPDCETTPEEKGHSPSGLLPQVRYNNSRMIGLATDLDIIISEIEKEVL